MIFHCRWISQKNHPDNDVPDTRFTHMVMQFGQFLDHDITLTPKNGSQFTLLHCWHSLKFFSLYLQRSWTVAVQVSKALHASPSPSPARIDSSPGSTTLPDASTWSGPPTCATSTLGRADNDRLKQTDSTTDTHSSGNSSMASRPSSTPATSMDPPRMKLPCSEPTVMVVFIKTLALVSCRPDNS